MFLIIYKLSELLFSDSISLPKTLKNTKAFNASYNDERHKVSILKLRNKKVGLILPNNV